MNDCVIQALPRMRTIKAAAAETGLAVFFVRQLIKKRKIKFVCAGRKYLVNLDSLISYLNEGEGVN
ncbi:MAG: DNA-binding protein [Ruminococcus sp.]|nr:DNA-binding protein [Ruminococcus sp.]